MGEGCLEFLNGRGELEPLFSRPFNDWEVDYVDRFLLSLHGKRVHRDENNKVLWKVTKNGKFIVRGNMGKRFNLGRNLEKRMVLSE
ncbi:hypothetical protein CK203_101573 [Vitis vinifera]|uniref:Uncharacterized protein n=1 Tax=Vitis vinifera TaxID=29760 RepID=A0A438DMU0_VITVI|nr:hypothetical protein CK203_101573 [Vitis vinifera]